MNTVEAARPSGMTCHRGSSTICGRLLIGGNAGARCASDQFQVAPMHRFQLAAMALSMCSFGWRFNPTTSSGSPKFVGSACADTQRDVGEMQPVSAQLYVQVVFRCLYSGVVRCRTSFLRRPMHQGAKGVSPDPVYAHAYGSLVQPQLAGCTIWVRGHELLP